MEYLSPRELLVLAARSRKYAQRPRPSIRTTQQAPAEPLVSVIIATYNWSSVLRLAIHSVLWQTLQDFEVIVAGDGCTDDSESVVQSFGDARIRWHNLPENHGHQTPANNAVLRLARGRYIAYLGHDDIWHPEHLMTLVEAATRANADFSSSLVEMIRPEGSHYRELGGIFPWFGYKGAQGLPISGVLHRRDVIDRIGEWKDYRIVWRNPDVDFVFRAAEAGMKFVSTGEMTVFKFNSSIRKNCYIERPCVEQKSYIERIQREPDFMWREVVALARVSLRRKRPVLPKVPTPPHPHTPGWRVPFYRKYRGLQ